MKKFLFAMLTISSLLLSCNHVSPNTEGTELPVNETTPDNTKNTIILPKAIFNTNNIKRITFYSYYGQGNGSDVPDKNMTEIIEWLGTFSIDKKAFSSTFVISSFNL